MKFKKKNKVNFKPKKHDDTFETDYEEEVLKNPTKWYEEVPEDPAEFKPVTDQQLIELKDEAKKLHDAETLAYSTKNARTNKSSDYQWIRTVLAKGTSSDKIAAYTILIQDNPVFNLKSIQDLVGMVKVSKKKECLTVIQTLSELFLQDLLKSDVKLKAFHQRPLSMLNELTSGNIVTRKRRLVLWYFEDQLKETYTSFVQALTKAAHDTVEATKEKAINAMYHLLAEHPEQEKNLLTNIVNKLGDPSQKVAAKTIFCLGQLLFKHPNMKDIVLTEIEKLLFRSNVSHKAQYYSICFLSQYFLTHEDSEVAKHLITVYFAFFRSCVKKDEINSKMMSALLMGVNRAYPYAKLELNQVNEHIDTIYKVVHQANFNVGLHALALLFQVCDLRNSVNDRFYSALYKKMFDPNINVSTHQAMFLNLIFKAIKRDENVERINVFIKRLLQIALNTTVPMSCGILYTISQFCRLKKHKLLLLNRNTNHIKQDTSHSETIDDILAKDKKTAKNKTAESVEENTMNNHENSEKIIEENTLLVNTDTSITNTIDNIVKQEIDKENKHTRVEYYDPHHRNPLYAGGEFCVHSELSILQEHFHPSVALFSKNLVNGQKIDYSGDPLKDFTLIRFLDRFVFKNPKKIDENDESTKKSGYHFKFGQRKSYVPDGLRSIPITSNNYLKEAESKIPVDELFMYRFLQKKIQNKTAKAEDDEDIESDHESVNSDEFNEMLDQMVGKNKGTTESDDEDDVDFMNEVGDALKVPKTKSKKKKSDEVDEEESEDEQASIDDQDEDEFDEDDLNNDDDLELDSDDAEDLNLDDPDISDDDFDDIKSSKSKKKSGKSDDVTSAFASAEEFAMMLEKTGSSKFKHGTSNAMFNDDKSDEKQMAWEQKRNHWISGFNSALGKKRKSKNVIPVKGQKRKKPNHIQKGKKKIKNK